MEFNLKKGWTYLLLSAFLSILSSILVIFFFQDDFKLQKILSLECFLLSLYFIYQFKYFAIKKSIISTDKNIEKPNEVMGKLFLIKSSKATHNNKHRKPIFHYNFCKITFSCSLLLSFLFINGFFVYVNFNDEILNILKALFVSLIISFFVLRYVFYKPLYACYLLFFKDNMYYSKKILKDGSQFYIKRNNSTLIFKNNKLHSDILPAFFKDIKESLRFSNLDYSYYDKKPIEGLEKYFQEGFIDTQPSDIEWFIHGEKIKNTENIIDYNEIKKKLKIFKNSKGF